MLKFEIKDRSRLESFDKLVKKMLQQETKMNQEIAVLQKLLDTLMNRSSEIHATVDQITKLKERYSNLGMCGKNDNNRKDPIQARS